MKRATLSDLNMNTRGEVLHFLKLLWGNQGAPCPVCGEKLTLLHQKAKKSDCDWQCKNCDMTYKTLYLLDEANEFFK